MTTINGPILVRRGTAAAWTAANPTLAAGEIGLETDTGNFKVGDGATAWNALAYVQAALKYSGVVAATVTSGGLIQIPEKLGLRFLTPGQPFNVYSSDATFAGTRDDFAAWAYNVNPADGSALDAGEPQWSWNLEANFNDGADHWVESNNQYVGAGGAPQRRPITTKVNRTTHESAVGLWAKTIYFGNSAGSALVNIDDALSPARIDLRASGGASSAAFNGQIVSNHASGPAAPNFTFYGQATKDGIYSNALNTVSVSTNGVWRLTVADAGVTMNAGIGMWGHAAPAAQPADPGIAAGPDAAVINAMRAILRGQGACA